MTQDLPDFRRPIAYAEQIAHADCKGGLVHTLVGQANARYGDERNRTVFQRVAYGDEASAERRLCLQTNSS